ncbi:helix-turn-helix domain-containing protein [Spiribacter onubensis]|uniref:helix-turn-helix domain-containing protein n=1 Tax=Spiribacter onubensis TaxID=3122420 RepID=UPI00349FBB7A
MLLKITEAAEQLRVSPRQIRRLVDSGQLRVVRLGSSSKADRIHPDDLTDFVNSQRKARPRCQSSSVTAFGTPKFSTTANASSDLRAKLQRAGTRSS